MISKALDHQPCGPEGLELIVSIALSPSGDWMQQTLPWGAGWCMVQKSILDASGSIWK